MVARSAPHDCPAVTKGHGLQFDSSEDYDVCPHLRDRGVAPCSAVCVPVAINGTATGVLHSIGPQHTHMDRDAVAQLELIAGRAGDRIGVLRAFNRSEAQAATDPLTGLLNRRSFEEEVKALSIAGTRFSIAYGDLDQFKAINDRHGHPTGDRVLGVFSRAIRECLRPGDLRRGGVGRSSCWPSLTHLCRPRCVRSSEYEKPWARWSSRACCLL